MANKLTIAAFTAALMTNSALACDANQITAANMQWLRSAQGELTLVGTPLRITYEPDKTGPFRLHSFHKSQTVGFASLEGAKLVALRQAKELCEMGLISLKDTDT